MWVFALLGAWLAVGFLVCLVVAALARGGGAGSDGPLASRPPRHVRA
jgi:hypothetical protein